MNTIQIKLLPNNTKVPVRANATDAGMDVFATEDILIKPMQTHILPLGFQMAIPEGYEATIRQRSGITSRTNLHIELGTIDSPYRGEVGAIVRNISMVSAHEESIYTLDKAPDQEQRTAPHSYQILKGDKIAQIVISPIVTPSIQIVDELNETARGTNGFGSTGTKGGIQ